MRIPTEKTRTPNSGIAAVLLLAGLLCVAPLSPCRAAEDSSSIQETKLESITVTAQKREEDVQDVTASITVLSDVAIEDARIESTKDIWQYVPNLSMSYTGSRDGAARIKMRGISNTAIGDPGVALYIDDVSYADVYAFDATLFDVERIEVLMGPQGTLYGKNTEGGAIHVVTKTPGNDFGAKVGLEAGNYDKRLINGLISVPLAEDKLFLRMTALKSSRDGYIKNLYDGKDIGNQDTTAANARLLYTPIGKLAFDLTFRFHEYDDGGGYPMVPMDKDQYMAVTGITDLSDFEASFNYSGESSSKSNTTSLRIKYEQDHFDLVSVTAYRDMDNEGSLDGDYSPYELYTATNFAATESMTQELRLQSKDSDESFKWLLGLYYGDDEKTKGYSYAMDSYYADMMGVPVYTVMEEVSASLGAENMAVFGQSTIRFLGDALGLTAGLRYESSERTMDREQTALGSLPVFINGLEKTYSELLPRLAMDYRVNDNAMTYASIAKGYKAGGFSYGVSDPELAGFDPEVSTAFEFGLKTEFPEQGLRVNLAGFYTKVDDYQDRVQLDLMTVVQANVTETDIYGLELETSYVLTDTLTLTGFLGYTNAEYGEYIDPMTGVDYNGNRVALIPEYDLGLFLEYRNQLGIFARAEMQHVGSCYFDRANTREQDAYSLYNMKIGYEQNRWDIYLSAKNLTDEQYFLESYEDATLGWVGATGVPRTIGLIFNYRF
jgi:iron complex outermembrane receptor protein